MAEEGERARRQADLEAEAKAAVARSDFDKAAEHLEALLGMAPDHLWALDMLGFCYYFLGRPGDAEGCCRRALEIDADHAYARKGLGLCLAAQGKVEEGIAELRAAVAAAPGYYDARHDLGVTLLQAGRKAEALEAFEGAAKVDPAQGRGLQGTIAKLRREVGEAGPPDGSPEPLEG
jgi:tetratricopeptide (TPR) repeat protein